MDVALVPLLGQRGFDVVSPQAVGPRRVDDRRVLERAVGLGRVLIAQNTSDFKSVHAAFVRAGQPHLGVVCLPQRGPLGRKVLRAAMMLDWIATQPHKSRLVAWGHLRQLLEQGVRLPGYGEDDVRDALGWA
jgi:Domain of unknown function (DUF5615)